MHSIVHINLDYQRRRKRVRSIRLRPAPFPDSRPESSVSSSSAKDVLRCTGAGFDFLRSRNKTVVIAVFLLYSTPGRTKSQLGLVIEWVPGAHRTSFRPSFITSFDMQISSWFRLGSEWNRNRSRNLGIEDRGGGKRIEWMAGWLPSDQHMVCS